MLNLLQVGRIPAAFKVSGATKADILKAVRNVQLVSGAQQVMLVGTGLALSAFRRCRCCNTY